MQERPAPGTSDAELVARARDGDREAFAAIYDRYADRLHDFSWSMLRNADDAADATQDTFLRAVERLGQLKDPSRLRPWLYSIARHEALARLRSRKRQVPDEAMPDAADPDPGPDAAASQQELRQLVWDAAAGLGERDRVLLDLHVRQGLDGAELAEAAGVGTGHAYVLLNRLRNQVERSLGALLVARLGRTDCAELDAILADWDGAYSALVRKRVARHVEDCDVCGERRRTAASPMALLSTVPVMLAPPELRDVVLTAFGAPRAGGGDDGPTPGWWPGRKRPAALTAGAAIVAGGVVTAILLFPGDDAPPLAVADPGAAAGETSSPTPLAPTTDSVTPTEPTDDDAQASDGTPTPADIDAEPSPDGGDGGDPDAPPPPDDDESPEPPPDPAKLTVGATGINLGAEAVEDVVQLRNEGGTPLSYDVSTAVQWLSVDHTSGSIGPGAGRGLHVTADRSELAEGDYGGVIEVSSPAGGATIDVSISVERAPLIERLAADPAAVGVRQCESDSSLVSAQVSDESGVAGVDLSWSSPDGSGTAAMTMRAGSWYAGLGPFDTPGQVTWQVEATDNRGNVAVSESRTLTVNPCPQ